jgi:mannose-1-phosphate guanylyltransferase
MDCGFGIDLGGRRGHSGPVKQAFLLGAGLGTRLRPLTDRLPKPLVPLFQRPLAEWALRACCGLGVERFAVNTHHLPQAWEFYLAGFRGGAAGEGLARCSVDLFHEPTLLDTGGGLANLAGWVVDEPLLVHNGDIFTTLPLERLVAAHEASGLPVTLALRSQGVERRVAVNAEGNRVTDLRGILGRPGTHVFTGVCCVNPEFVRSLPRGEVFSLVPAWLEWVRRGAVGACVLDEGEWLDLGDFGAYLVAHRTLALEEPVHASARVADGAVLDRAVIGAGAEIGAGAVVRDSVLWPGANVAAGAVLERCVVGPGGAVAGAHQDAALGDWRA